MDYNDERVCPVQKIFRRSGFLLFDDEIRSSSQSFYVFKYTDDFAGCSSLVLGNQVQACMFKFGIPFDVVLSTSLLDMYGKCRDIHAAFCVFKSMSIKKLVSWNSIIGGCARHRLAEMALVEFEEMLKSGVMTDEITFVNVLSACAHGLVKKGEELFYSMRADYGMEAEMEHYACMVDLYCMEGELENAKKLIKGMPFEPDVVAWVACGLHSCVELGETAAERIFELEQDYPAVYSMLSNMRHEKGINDGVISLEKIVQKCMPENKRLEVGFNLFPLLS